MDDPNDEMLRQNLAQDYADLRAQHAAAIRERDEARIELSVVRPLADKAALSERTWLATCNLLRDECDEARAEMNHQTEMLDNITRQRDEARAQGRAEGLEEAATACDARANTFTDVIRRCEDDGLSGEAFAHKVEACDCATAIRALKNAPPLSESELSQIGKQIAAFVRAELASGVAYDATEFEAAIVKRCAATLKGKP